MKFLCWREGGFSFRTNTQHFFISLILCCRWSVPTAAFGTGGLFSLKPSKIDRE